jgi:hypothetical protein
MTPATTRAAIRTGYSGRRAPATAVRPSCTRDGMPYGNLATTTVRQPLSPSLLAVCRTRAQRGRAGRTFGSDAANVPARPSLPDAAPVGRGDSSWALGRRMRDLKLSPAGPLCLLRGQSGLMLVQRPATWLLDQVTAWLAAVQRMFSEAALQVCEIGGKPNRPFAAQTSDVSHADEAAACSTPLVQPSFGCRRSGSKEDCQVLPVISAHRALCEA